MRKIETKITKEMFCEDCHLCKAKNLPHREKIQDKIDEERIKGIRKGVIHSDLMGKLKSSIGGCQYVLTYICSQTEYSYVYLFKKKSEQLYYYSSIQGRISIQMPLMAF